MIAKIVFLAVLACAAAVVWAFVASMRRAVPGAHDDTAALETIFAVLLALILSISWFGLILAEIGVFSLETLAVLLAIGVAGVGLWLRRRMGSVRLRPLPRIDRYDAGALILAVGFALLFGRANEWVPGGLDPGSYVNIGINIARTGAILIHDQAMASVAPEHRTLLLYSQTGPDAMYDGTVFPAFYVLDIDTATVLPQFFHVFPVWIAIFYELAGARAALLATPLFGVLSVVAVYLLGRRLAHPAVGLVAMLLLGVNISQLWFARSPFADIVVQYFLVGGLWALVLLTDYLDDAHGAAGFAGILAGGALGMTHLVKLDAYMIAPAVVGFFLLLWVLDRFRRPHGYALVVYLLLVVHSFVHGYLFAWPYVTDTFRKLIAIGPVRLLAVGTAAGVVGIAVIGWQRRRLAGIVDAVVVRREPAGRLFVLAILVLSLYGYFVRPFRADLGTLSEEEVARRGAVTQRLMPLAIDPQTVTFEETIRTYVEENIVRAGWYLTPVGVWLAIVGFTYWTTRHLSIRALPFLGTAFLVSVLMFYRGAIVPYFFWVFKRFIPLVIPAFMLFIAFLLWEWWPTQRERWQKGIPSLLLGAFLFASYVGGSIQFWGHSQYEGSLEDAGELHESMPEDAVVLIERSDLANRIGLPLKYIFGRDAYHVDHEYVNNDRLRHVVATWQNSGRPVYWLSPRCRLLPWSYGPLEKVAEDDLEWPEVPKRLDALPDRIAAFKMDYCLYDIAGTDYTFPRNVERSFDNRIMLLGYELEERSVPAGQELELTLYWKAQRRIPVDYTIFTHVVDADGRLWGQTDRPAGTHHENVTSRWRTGDLIADTVTIPIGADTPPGRYALRIGLYRLDTMGRLSVLDHLGNPATDHVTVEDITVEAASQ